MWGLKLIKFASFFLFFFPPPWNSCYCWVYCWRLVFWWLLLFVKLYSYLSACEHYPWTPEGSTGHGNAAAWWSPLLFISAPLLHPGPVCFSHSSPCCLTVILHLLHLLLLPFLFLPLLQNSLTCFASLCSRTVPASDDVGIFLFTVSPGPKFYFLGGGTDQFESPWASTERLLRWVCS